jgi:hypothetical protein
VILLSMRPQHRWLRFGARHSLDGRAALRQCLHAVVEDEKTAGDFHYELVATQQARRRDLLDGWLHGLIEPGNRLELFDGLHARSEISHAISPEFTGVLDLTICTSTYLGDYLGRAAAQRFRTVQFIELQDFLEASIRISLALTFFAQSELTYLAARAAVSKVYMRVLDEMGRFGGHLPMNRLRPVLLQIQQADTKAGGTLSDNARTRLGALQRTLTAQGWLIFTAVFAGAALAIWTAILNIQDPKSLATFSGA